MSGRDNHADLTDHARLSESGGHSPQDDADVNWQGRRINKIWVFKSFILSDIQNYALNKNYIPLISFRILHSVSSATIVLESLPNLSISISTTSPSCSHCSV